MFIIQEIQKANETCEPVVLEAVIKATRREAEAEYHMKAAYAALGTAYIDTIKCYAETGEEILPPICYQNEEPVES